MARYLLGTQCFLDIAKRVGTPSERWYETADTRGVGRGDIYISAVTPMILTAGFEGCEQTPVALALFKNCERLVDRFVRAGQVAPVTKPIADRWHELNGMALAYNSGDGKPSLYRYPEKLVLATAIDGLDGRPFTLVESRQPAHGQLAGLGLVLEDPNDLSYSP